MDFLVVVSILSVISTSIVTVLYIVTILRLTFPRKVETISQETSPEAPVNTPDEYGSPFKDNNFPLMDFMPNFKKKVTLKIEDTTDHITEIKDDNGQN